MRAIIINSELQTVSESDIEPSLANLQRLVGGLIEPVYHGLDEGHLCWVNEEGLLSKPQHFFMFRGGHQPLAGNGVILGRSDDGKSNPCTLAIDAVRHSVTFIERAAIERWASQFD